MKALEINKKNLGDNHPTIAVNYSNIAEVFLRKGEIGNAVQTLQNALKIDLAYFKEYHPKVAFDFNNLGIIYFEQNNILLSIQNLRKSIKIKMRLNQEGNVELAETFLWIGKVLEAILDEREARKALLRAKTLRKQEVTRKPNDAIVFHANQKLIWL